MRSRLSTIKTVLWLITGMLAAVSVFRFLKGLGATTNLSDAAPWGFWIAFDVMSGVALAAGGFVMAAAVYIFKLENYRPIVRPAVLTAFLGYAAVATGLLYDLGIPWHIWHPIIYPQIHSVLFEVAMCVMLYLTVLFLEFSPVILEHPLFGKAVYQKAHGLLKKMTIVLVMAGVILSTLHQSSLGSLFLIAPHRVHPLWYSPNIWLLFLISAVGLGFMTVVMESFISAWLFGHKLKMNLLSGLGKAASVVLFLYLILRLGDLGVRGILRTAFDGSSLAWLFVVELLVSAAIPALLLAIPRVRSHPKGLIIASVMTVLGMIGYRFNVCIVAFARPSGVSYIPSWTELVVSLGIVAGALLIFIFFIEHLKVYSEESDDVKQRDQETVKAYNPYELKSFLPESLSAPRRYSLVFVIGATIATAFLWQNMILKAKPLAVPVSVTREVDGFAVKRTSQHGNDFLLIQSGGHVPADSKKQSFMMIDGNRDGRLVLFPHDEHVEKLGNRKSCNKCHHQNMPFQHNSSCGECHRDMYSVSDTFDHSSHIFNLEGNKGCKRCHKEDSLAKTRMSSTPCRECHKDMASTNPVFRASERSGQGYASGYMDAMHGLCIHCHEKRVKAKPASLPKDFARCTQCHRDENGSLIKEMPPYAAAKNFRPTGRQ